MGNREAWVFSDPQVIATSSPGLASFPAQADQIRLLWTRSCCRLYSALSTNITREVSRYLVAYPLIAQVTGEGVRLLDLCANSWRRPVPYSQPVKVLPDSSFLGIDSRRLFLCGGNRHSGEGSYYTPADRSASLITIGNEVCSVEALPDMLAGHGYPGLLSYEERVYVFGGDFHTGQCQ